MNNKRDHNWSIYKSQRIWSKNDACNWPVLTGTILLLTLLASDTGSSAFFSGLEIIPVCNSLSNRELISNGAKLVAAKECKTHLITLQYFLEFCWQIIYANPHNIAFSRNKQSLLVDFFPSNTWCWSNQAWDWEWLTSG